MNGIISDASFAGDGMYTQGEGQQKQRAKGAVLKRIFAVGGADLIDPRSKLTVLVLQTLSPERIRDLQGKSSRYLCRVQTDAIPNRLVYETMRPLSAR
jgi:hypothetical protein